MRYELLGDATALDYFMVDPQLGAVSLRQSLALDPQRSTAYNVRFSLVTHLQYIFRPMEP